ncbi:MAG: GNAT family N-acetyltransferase [Marmoricola sp.]|nr:GNAT family N-acetyltransferase [Marmoricola sp.]
MEPRGLAGLGYLAAVTSILQDVRLADPTAGLWEAADMHWWWREDQHTDPAEHQVWFDGGRPVAAAVFGRWGQQWGADVIGRPEATSVLADELWGFVAERHRHDPVEMLVREDDEASLAAAGACGFHAQETPLRTGWMDAADRPGPVDPPDGFALTSYDGGRHWMAPRNGDRVAELLAETGLYRRDLDLALTHEGEVVAYALFWADPVTGVGLVEPMRVEDAFSGRGLGRVLLRAGLYRLAAGCARLKVSFDPSNTAAARLYLGAGFRPVSRARLMRRPPGA